MPVIVGATSALGLMSVIFSDYWKSVFGGPGKLFEYDSNRRSSTSPVVNSLLFFGLKSLKDANEMPKKTKESRDNNNGNSLVDKNDGVTIEGALAEAAEDVCAKQNRRLKSRTERVDGHSKHHRSDLFDFCRRVGG